ncbi:uncharacterized protein LOC133837078 [Drosophila sulfurigaster albostrigata]|uniref:uncharacterized protein LOC133837078 n=1 Tax=Drosophila sulfurigaster albostrigata TaxID=89887 RepID=UPI002D21E9C6|nr:uncharacterized protein LOC133837078 [Drosophila sulfurigaster albostrigata]
MKGSIVGLWLLTAVITLNLKVNSEVVGYRLSRYIRPSFYNLSINIQDDASNPGTTFNGEVAITLQSNQSNLLEITLHNRLLNITRCLLYNKDGRLQQDIAAGQLRYNNETELLTVPLLQPLIANANYTLYFKYSGESKI